MKFKNPAVKHINTKVHLITQLESVPSSGTTFAEKINFPLSFGGYKKTNYLRVR